MWSACALCVLVLEWEFSRKGTIFAKISICCFCIKSEKRQLLQIFGFLRRLSRRWQNFAIFRGFRLNLIDVYKYLNASAEGSSEKIRVFYRGTACDIIIFKFQMWGFAPFPLPCWHPWQKHLGFRFSLHISTRKIILSTWGLCMHQGRLERYASRQDDLGEQSLKTRYMRDETMHRCSVRFGVRASFHYKICTKLLLPNK